VHGSGTWLQGRTKTTERLLLLEGSGLLATFASGAVLFSTGAARNVVAPAALTAVGGVGTFALSLLASWYATWAPYDGWGTPVPRWSLLEASVGYTHVNDPQFEFHHFLTTRLEARIRPDRFSPALSWHLGVATAHAPDQGNQRFELLTGLRTVLPYQSSREPDPHGAYVSERFDNSYLEPRVGFIEHRFDGSGFVTRVFQLELEARLDSWRILPDTFNAFFQLGAGWAKQWFAFDLPGVDASNATSLLLAHMGFGAYVGQGGELELYYDHRHDGFAGGLKVSGLGSGVAGHFGLRGEVPISPAWGLRAEAQVGSAWVLGLSALLRVGSQP
jgi:hypothetical protein